ncbi:piggyBac transposable element-derived protein 4-like [Argopecten irradians]|uniref:piggyBac transposable element-derived protein 4-like n=1 Tax=Argopecten irradians TaxID=31199 RepID=UPI00371F3424
MEDNSDNDSDIEYDAYSSDENDAIDGYRQITKLWTRVQNADEHEYPHEVREFVEDMGPIDPPDANSDPIEYFNMFAVPETGSSLTEILVQETNRYARQYFEKEGYASTPCSRSNEWKDTNLDEMSAFIGLYLAMGIVKKPSIESYWNTSDKTYLYNTHGFSSVMTRNRFQLIMKFLHCNNNNTHIPRGQEGHDPCHKFRPVLDLFNQTFKMRYNAARDLTIDESMVGFKGRHDIVQYLPAKKAHRWGAKFFVLAESDTGYAISLKLYSGRQGNEDRSTNGLGYDVCMALIQPFLGKNHHLIVDNYYTSPTLCDALFDRGTYMTGTVRVYRRGMPSSFKGIRLKKGEMEIRQSGSTMALAYGDRKTVTFLSTMASPR